MKKVWLLVGVSFFLCILLIHKQNKTDKLVGLAFSSNMVRLYEITGNLSSEILENVDSSDAVLLLIEESKIGLENELLSLHSFRDINKNFEVNSMAVRDLFNWLELNVIENGKLSTSDIEVLNALIELNKEYKSAARYSTYKESAYNFKRLELPLCVTEYFESVEKLVEQVRYNY